MDKESHEKKDTEGGEILLPGFARDEGMDENEAPTRDQNLQQRRCVSANDSHNMDCYGGGSSSSKSDAGAVVGTVSHHVSAARSPLRYVHSQNHDSSKLNEVVSAAKSGESEGDRELLRIVPTWLFVRMPAKLQRYGLRSIVQRVRPIARAHEAFAGTG